MRSHCYKPTKKNNIRKCSLCGALSYDSSIALIPEQLKSSYLFPSEHTPSVSAVIDYQNKNHINYLSKRRTGIRNIRYLVKVLHYSPTVLYKAIAYMDKIFLSSETHVKLINNVSTICVLLSLQFNECCSKIPMEDLFTLIRLIPNYNELEIHCLICLGYDLSVDTPYDYINRAFTSGIVFLKENDPTFDINILYSQCLMFMDGFIEDERALDFSSDVLAMTIIKLNCEQYSHFNSKVFQYVYDISFRNSNYALCYCILVNIVAYKKEEQKHKSKSRYINRAKQSSSMCYSSTSTVISVCSISDNFF